MKSKSKSIIKFGLFSLIQLITQLLGLLTNIIITNKVSVEEYGIYSIILVFIGLIMTIGFSWTSSMVSFYGSKEIVINGNMSRTLKGRNVLLLISTSLTFLVFLLAHDAINSFIGYEFSLLIFFWVVIKALHEYLAYYFIAREKKIISSTVGLVVRASTVITLLVLNVDLKFVLIISILCEILALISIIFVDKDDFKSTRLDKPYFKEISAFALWQLIGSVAIYIINFSNNFFIKHFHSSFEVGLFNSAFILFNGLFIFSNVISSFYVATVSRYFQESNVESIRYFFYRIRLLLFGLALIGHVILFIFSEAIIHFMFPIDYIGAVPVLKYLLVASLCRYWSVFYMLYLNINKMHHIQQYLNVITAIVIVLLNLFLIPSYGVVGAAIATSSTILLQTIISSLICEPRIKYYVVMRGS